MELHVRIHRGVLVWFYVGVVCGAIALVNILGRNLSPTQVNWILAIGALHWLIGGILCYAWDAIRIEKPAGQVRDIKRLRALIVPQTEWHCASDFLLPGNRKSLIPPRY